jgi:pimeloyl-ACP methyl ester carboxylesterase
VGGDCLAARARKLSREKPTPDTEEEMERLRLAHDDTSKGDNSLVLIHGAYGDRTVYAEQVRHFATSYRVITLDLRGHGDTEKPVGEYSIGQFAEDVAGLCSSLGIDSASVVGHSMGGVVAVELASRHPGLVRAIATLDSPSIIPGWTEGHMGPYTEEIHGPNFRDVLREFLDVASSPLDDPKRRQEALSSIDQVPEHVVTAVWDALLAWKPETALGSLKAPLLYLDHGQPDLDYEALRRLCPQVLVGQTVGAGHRALQEVPDQVSAMLQRFFSHAEILAEHAVASRGTFRYKAEN